MAALLEREGGIEEFGDAREHLGAALRVVDMAGREHAVARDHVGAVKRVVKAAPAGIGGVERVARVGDGHHQLRTADLGDLGIEPLGLDGEVLGLGLEVADLLEEGFIAFGIGRHGPVGLVPSYRSFAGRVSRTIKSSALRGMAVATRSAKPVPECLGRPTPRGGQRLPLR